MITSTNFSRVLNCLLLATLLVSVIMPAGVLAAVEPDAVVQPKDSSANTALQFNGTNQYLGFGVAHHPSSSDFNATWDATNKKFGTSALGFDGATNYVSFGPAPILGLHQFTLELWFRRTGPGLTANTDGITVVPLITKGRTEADNSNLDTNYFLGICGSVLCADFEDTETGANHPVSGVTNLSLDTWYHAAVTYDGTAWALYLDGSLETSETEGATPRFDSLQHAGLATAMNSSGIRSGYFAGQIDEARIWSYARTQTEIQATKDSEVTSASRLIARFGLNENSGTSVTDTSNDGLGVTSFTLEAWAYWTGEGITTTTGTSGLVNPIPLITKGRDEGEASTQDMNYFLGIDKLTGKLVADFEESAGSPSPGLNHPAYGSADVTINTWHHVAVTYDGHYWSFYLDGVLDNTQLVSSPSAIFPRSDSIQRAAIGSAVNSGGIQSGYFKGFVDEVRVWNIARTATEIFDNKYVQIDTQVTGLVGRWGFEEGTGEFVSDSGPYNVNGRGNPAYNPPTRAEGVFVPAGNPASPTNLQVCPFAYNSVCLTWLDNATNENNFQVQRSTDGGTSWNPLASVTANTVLYNDTTGSPSTPYCYRVRGSIYMVFRITRTPHAPPHLRAGRLRAYC